MSLADRHVLVVDISDTLETKLAAIACYASQFPPRWPTSSTVFAVRRCSRACRPVLRPAKCWPVRPSGAHKDLMGLLFRAEQPPRET